MKTTKGLRIALFGALLLFAGSVTVLAQAAQQAGDQSQTDSNTVKKEREEFIKCANGPGDRASPSVRPNFMTIIFHAELFRPGPPVDRSATGDIYTWPLCFRGEAGR